MSKLARGKNVGCTFSEVADDSQAVELVGILTHEVFRLDLNQ